MRYPIPGLILVAMVLIGCREGDPCDGVPVKIDGAQVVEVCAQLAVTEEERRRGLIGTTSLAENEALLIRFPVTGEVCIVNSGVPFPIDVVYADEQGTIVAIERELSAQSNTPRCADGVKDVLEVAAGVAAPFQAGDILRVASD